MSAVVSHITSEALSVKGFDAFADAEGTMPIVWFTAECITIVNSSAIRMRIQPRESDGQSYTAQHPDWEGLPVLIRSRKKEKREMPQRPNQTEQHTGAGKSNALRHAGEHSHAIQSPHPIEKAWRQLSPPK